MGITYQGDTCGTKEVKPNHEKATTMRTRLQSLSPSMWGIRPLQHLRPRTFELIASTAWIPDTLMSLRYICPNFGKQCVPFHVRRLLLCPI